MKKTATFLLIILIAVVSCKTAKKATTSENAYEAALKQNPTPAKVFSVPETKTEVEKPDNTPITIKREDISFTQKEDETKNNVNSYFVIVGSFSNLDNAKNYRQTLISEGFTPIILQSNTSGYYRICVNSFKNEMEARTRVHQIRRDFPKYYDSWLLIKE
ncbi:MAG: SPOR domain-containing protein [Prolixibacteraceae bacterium]|nr:SPOR domain-containing protein [Prolixibacteraceae bacterium]MBN2772965.1 SPOR domain-containing protein [Prolixibacteraceae bacterium]